MSTMAEKVLARASGRARVRPGEVVTARVDRLMAHEAFAACAAKLAGIGATELHDPDRVVVVFDHFSPAPTAAAAEINRVARGFVKHYGIRQFLGHEGIGNQLMTERALVRPGDLVLGTDSHTTTCGAIGAAGTGVGYTEAAYVMATGELWFEVPETVRFVLRGELDDGVSSKDVVLHLAQAFGTEAASYRAIEFSGPAAKAMSVASRMTMANMGVELGAKFALFAVDETTRAYLEPRAGEPIPTFGPDLDAAYAASHDVDIGAIEPLVACPHHPGNVRAARQLGDVAVDQAFLGSCTNARLEDFAVAARILRGRRVSDGTRLVVTPASNQVLRDAAREGYLDVLLAAGASVTATGCGACPGGHSGVLGSGDTCISSTNRNFRGRMGSSDAHIYLGSPATVAASAVTGRITDPRQLLQD